MCWRLWGKANLDTGYWMLDKRQYDQPLSSIQYRREAPIEYLLANESKSQLKGM
jgi:hypothetical protein